MRKTNLEADLVQIFFEIFLSPGSMTILYLRSEDRNFNLSGFIKNRMVWGPRTKMKKSSENFWRAAQKKGFPNFSPAPGFFSLWRH